MKSGFRRIFSLFERGEGRRLSILFLLPVGMIFLSTFALSYGGSFPSRDATSDPSYFDFSDWASLGAPAPIGTPDTVAVNFSVPLADTNYTIVYGGYKGDQIENQAGTRYNIEVEAKTQVGSKTVNGFVIDLTYTAYLSATNAFVGSWDNLNAMMAALNMNPQVMFTPTVDWRVLKTIAGH